LISDDENSDAKAERMDESGEDTSVSKPEKAITDEGTDSVSKNRKEAVQKETAKQSRMNQELKKLDSLFNPTGMERQLVVETDGDGEMKQTRKSICVPTRV
jgi:hypothetical protein